MLILTSLQTDQKIAENTAFELLVAKQPDGTAAMEALGNELIRTLIQKLRDGGSASVLFTHWVTVSHLINLIRGRSIPATAPPLPAPKTISAVAAANATTSNRYEDDRAFRSLPTPST